MSPRVRLLPWAAASGAANMAADDALLESAAAGVASLRFYGFSVPTLSLGYFQPAAAARAQGRLGELAWVRRPSGGAALVHHHELTYALALPAGPAWQPPGVSLLARAHQLIGAALAELGVHTRLCEGSHKRGEVLCFLHHTPGDLLLGACKVVGSAQRKQRGAVMQHGGILLGQSPYTPQLPGIAELSGRAVEPAELQSAIVEALRRQAGWAVEPDDWTAVEKATLEARARSRYTAVAWNEKR